MQINDPNDKESIEKQKSILEKFKLTLPSGEPLRIAKVLVQRDRHNFPNAWECGYCYGWVQTDFKYCPHCGKLLCW